ncbi:uncharacterized protein LOC116853647 [Odontomachus brunneus]|uniref:uncharacterized protein LOC116853647 n=1 Tax=Odontomachus brunneus TaxID=486640 RepID=UPI0013F28E73|nr:uncharacterized protein LOC116853647 [Odontomachus brunneus]
MRRARGQIDLGELGIGDLRTRRAVTGALVLEIPGPEGHARANTLANKMAALFADKEDVRIARPTKRADIRVRDLDDTATVEDVISAVAVVGGCGPGYLKAGKIRPGPDRMGTLWLRCLEWGHVRASCKSKVDRSGLCYHCGSAGHRAAACDAPATCPVCRDTGRPCGHRVGGPAC